MRILMTADTVGGVWTYALDLADALAPHGIEVELATMGRLPDGEQRAAVARSAVTGLHTSGFALEWQDDPWDDVDRAGEWLLELDEELAPDLVHCNGYAHAALPWRAPVVVAAHSDVVSWWRAVRRTEPPASWNRYRVAVEAGLGGADAILAPTRAVVADLRAGYRFDTSCFVVPNGRAPAAATAVKEPLVVGLGRFWDEAKNVHLLERIAPRAPWPLLLAGAGTESGRLRPHDVAALLARASVFASPARYEPFGLAALEAAQAGCALVLGDIPSLREVWADAAWFVAPDDADGLLEALHVLAGNESRRAELAARARRRAARYTPEAMAAGVLGVYGRALARSRAAVGAAG
jgi:glycosyltransferase involved in cell wall biosynthesis